MKRLILLIWWTYCNAEARRLDYKLMIRFTHLKIRKYKQ